MSFEKEHDALEAELRDMISDEKLLILSLSVNDLLRDLHEADASGIFGPRDGGTALNMITSTLTWVLTSAAMIDGGATLDQMREIQAENDAKATANVLLHRIVGDAEERMN